MRLFLLALLSLFTFVPAALAQAEPPLPAPLEKQRAAGAQVFYLGKSQDTDGWVMVRGGQPEFYYVTPSGAIVLGILFDTNGNMVTPNQMIALQQARKNDLLGMVQPQTAGPVPAPDQIDTAPQTAEIQPAPTPPQAVVPAADSPSERLLASMQTAPGIVWGNPSAPMFSAFIDPNCVHCQQFLREAEPFVTSGRVSVRMVLVAFDDKSAQQAAFLLASADGADRMVRYAKGDATSIPVTGNADTTVLAKNTELMNTWNLRGTPHILYRGPDGKIRLIRGRPFDINATVNDLAPAH